MRRNRPVATGLGTIPLLLALAGLAGRSGAPQPGRAVAQDSGCAQKPGSLPTPWLAAGQAAPGIPVRHIIVIMQENHSFDTYLGRLNQPGFYGQEVDGITPEMANPDAEGTPVHPEHAPSLCLSDPAHSWNAMHDLWNQGRNDGFARINGRKALHYYDEQDLPFYYALANQFAVGDRYFASAMTQTFPNRFYLMAATSFGHVANVLPASHDDYHQRTIFDAMTAHGVSWKYYTDGLGYMMLFGPTYTANPDKLAKVDQFASDLSTGNLPSVVFLDSDWESSEDEHPSQNVQIGQAWVAARVRELMTSPYWKDSVLFLTYDEGGGFFDHVPPPAACAPDAIAPMLKPEHRPGDFARYGFRVPFMAVSPYVKHHYVSHRVYDHTSILRFIETRFNLPALTARDANADPLLDLFDFGHPDLAVPELPWPRVDSGAGCSGSS